MDWLDETIATYSEYESPKRFYYWSLLAAVSAVVKDKVYFDRYLYKLYPNIYVMLYGPSGIKKGPPIALAKGIVSRIGNTRVINGRASVEGIIKELGTTIALPNKEIIKDATAFIVSSELSSSLVGSTSSLDIITDLFDRIFNDDDWSYRLKNSESITLKSPTITWLSGTNEALFREFIPEKNLKGGLIGRTFIISEHKENGFNSLMKKPTVVPDKDKIANGIRHLSKLQGEFTMKDEVRDAFNDWYIKFKTEIAPKLEDDTGTVGRIDDNIIKIAMLTSLARRGDLEITLEDIMEGMTEILQLVAPARKITQNVKQNEVTMAEKRAIVIKHLANCDNYTDNKVDILRRFTLKMDHEDLDKIVQFLISSQVIQQSNVGATIIYSLNIGNAKVKEYVEQFQR